MLLKLLFLDVAVSLVQLAPQDSSAIPPVDLINDWKLFKTTFNKSYQSPTEEIKRFRVFQDNAKRMGESRTLLAGARKSSEVFNDFYDRTWDELVQTIMNLHQAGQDATEKPKPSLVQEDPGHFPAGLPTAIQSQGMILPPGYCALWLPLH